MLGSHESDMTERLSSKGEPDCVGSRRNLCLLLSEERKQFLLHYSRSICEPNVGPALWRKGQSVKGLDENFVCFTES